MKEPILTETQFIFRLGRMSGCAVKHNELTAEQCLEVRLFAMDLLSKNKELINQLGDDE